jgi:hypothetical protein
MNLSVTWNWFVNNLEWFLVIAGVYYSTKVNAKEKYYEEGFLDGYKRGKLVERKRATE